MPDQNTRLTLFFIYIYAYQYKYNETNYFRSSVSQNTNRLDGFIEIFFRILLLSLIQHATLV